MLAETLISLLCVVVSIAFMGIFFLFAKFTRASDNSEETSLFTNLLKMLLMRLVSQSIVNNLEDTSIYLVLIKIATYIKIKGEAT